MENRAHAAVAVTFLVLFAGAGVALFWWLTRGAPENRIYDIVSPYGVSGLQPQAEVSFKGLTVGHVKDVHFDPNDPQKIIIRIGVQPDAYITQASYAELSVHGITGLASISLHIDESKPQQPLPTTAAHPARLPMRRGLIQSLEARGKQILGRAERLLESANAVLDPENRKHLQQTIARLDVASQRLVDLEKRVGPTLAALPGLVQETRAAMEDSQALLKHVSGLVEAARGPVQEVGRAAGSVESMSRSGKTLAQQLSDETLPEIDALTERLSRTARRMDELARELRAAPQSVVTGAPPPPPGPGEPGFQPPQPGAP
jgi:phospholipid/cholesterol/gamma-HCH transport system substrate-binding protein